MYTVFALPVACRRVLSGVAVNRAGFTSLKYFAWTYDCEKHCDVRCDRRSDRDRNGILGKYLIFKKKIMTLHFFFQESSPRTSERPSPRREARDRGLRAEPEAALNQAQPSSGARLTQISVPHQGAWTAPGTPALRVR